MSYRKIGGLHFVKLGRFGFSFYWRKRRRIVRVKIKDLTPEVLNVAMSMGYKELINRNMGDRSHV